MYAAGAALGLTVILTFMLRGKPAKEECDGNAPVVRKIIPVRNARQKAPSARDKPAAEEPLLAFTDVDGDDADRRSPAEKKLAGRIDKALGEQDLKATIACVPEAQRCRVAEIRLSMVDALGWFGEKALPELTAFLADADEEVRERAASEWTTAVSSIKNESEKIHAVELAMGVLNDENALENISNEYIGADEKLAVESLCRIIAANKSASGVAKAKETYEFVTGDKWAGTEEALRWISEEYHPPRGE